MKGTLTLFEMPARPEQVLAIFQDWQRLEWGHSLNKTQILSFETSTKEWQDDGDLADWKHIGEALNEFFGMSISRDEWQTVMKPAKQKTLRDLCILIASHATLPRVNELAIFGRRCRPASSFFALRSLLSQAGLDVAPIRPSTKLDPSLRLHTETMTAAIMKLAPGKLPVMTTKHNLGHRISSWACVAGLLTLVISGIFDLPELTVFSCLVLLVGFLSITVFASRHPEAVHLAGLETFKDLSRLISDGPTGKECAA